MHQALGYQEYQPCLTNSRIIIMNWSVRWTMLSNSQSGAMLPLIVHPTSDMEDNVYRRGVGCVFKTKQHNTPVSPLCMWDAACACTCWNLWYATVGRIEPVHLHIISFLVCACLSSPYMSAHIRVRICETWRKHCLDIYRKSYFESVIRVWMTLTLHPELWYQYSVCHTLWQSCTQCFWCNDRWLRWEWNSHSKIVLIHVNVNDQCQ